MGYLIYWNLWIICKKFLGLNVYISYFFNKFMNYRKELYEWNFKKIGIILGLSWNIGIGLVLKGL